MSEFRRPGGRRWAAIVVLAGAWCGGCGISQGQLLYFMGFGQGRKAEAEFKLTREGPVVILVDDFEQQLQSPRTRTVLAEVLGRELQANDAVKEIISQERLDKLRRRRQDFGDLKSRQIGEMVGAHQLIYIVVREYYAPQDIEEISAAGRMTVTVKVLNVLEKEDKTKVRLWPPERQGRIVSVDLHANVMVKAKKPEVVSKLLAAAMAGQIVKLFYDYPLDDFE